MRHFLLALLLTCPLAVSAQSLALRAYAGAALSSSPGRGNSTFAPSVAFAVGTRGSGGQLEVGVTSRALTSNRFIYDPVTQTSTTIETRQRQLAAGISALGRLQVADLGLRPTLYAGPVVDFTFGDGPAEPVIFGASVGVGVVRSVSERLSLGADLRVRHDLQNTYGASGTKQDILELRIAAEF